MHSGILIRSNRLTGSITHAPSGTVKFLKPLFCSPWPIQLGRNPELHTNLMAGGGDYTGIPFPDISLDRLLQYFMTIAPVGDAFCLASLVNSFDIYKVLLEGDLGTCADGNITCNH